MFNSIDGTGVLVCRFRWMMFLVGFLRASTGRDVVKLRVRSFSMVTYGIECLVIVIWKIVGEASGGTRRLINGSEWTD